jgi:predicted RNase H-like HicB family nuclease
MATMESVTYKVVIEPLPEGGYGVEVPALPGCLTWGRTYEQAVAMAKEAIEVYLESLIKHGSSIPVERAKARVTLGISVPLPSIT